MTSTLGEQIDSALLEVLEDDWVTADMLARRACSAHPELNRELDGQRAGRRLSTLAKKGKVEKRDSDDGYYAEWRRA